MGRRSIHFVYACAMLVAMATSVVRAQSPEDTAMAQHVASSIKDSGQLSNYRLGVKYQDGVAWLLGSVTSADQQQKAVELARGVEGVDQVICKLQIEGGEVASEQPAQPVVKAEAKVAQPETASEASIELASTAANVQQPVQQMQQPTRLPRAAVQTAMRRPTGNAMPRPMGPQQASAARHAGMQGRPMPASYCGPCAGGGGGYAGGGMGPMPAGHVPGGSVGGAMGVSYDSPQMPCYAWPSYASHPNYAALTYPKQYSPTAWPYIGPFYPYPQVPLGWRKVCLEWDDGWWHLDFSHCNTQ